MRRGQHWLLSDAEAHAYGLALSNALRHLPVKMAQKYVDFSALAVAVLTYEGPRIVTDIQQRRRGGSPGTGDQRRSHPPPTIDGLASAPSGAGGAANGADAPAPAPLFSFMPDIEGGGPLH